VNINEQVQLIQTKQRHNSSKLSRHYYLSLICNNNKKRFFALLVNKDNSGLDASASLVHDNQSDERH
jgi:hypothetical protein